MPGFAVWFLIKWRQDTLKSTSTHFSQSVKPSMSTVMCNEYCAGNISCPSAQLSIVVRWVSVSVARLCAIINYFRYKQLLRFDWVSSTRLRWLINYDKRQPLFFFFLPVVYSFPLINFILNKSFNDKETCNIRCKSAKKKSSTNIGLAL